MTSQFIHSQVLLQTWQANNKEGLLSFERCCLFLLILLAILKRTRSEAYPKHLQICIQTACFFSSNLCFLMFFACFCQVLELRRWLGNVALFFSGASEKAGSTAEHVELWTVKFQVSARPVLELWRCERGGGGIHQSFFFHTNSTCTVGYSY